MAAPLGTPAGWAGVFVEWMHVGSIVLAILVPVVHAAARRFQGHRPCFEVGVVIHDAASGLTLPSFAALTLSAVSPSLSAHVEGHAAALAGLMGIVYTLGSVLKAHSPNGEPPSSRWS